MKKFEYPECEMIALENVDVITTSGGGGGCATTGEGGGDCQLGVH